jgi:hypothetical protein
VSVQLSNVPEVRPARRLLFLATTIFGALCLLNVVTTYLAFHDDDGDRWVNLVRLLGNIFVGLLIWRGYVALAALAERAALYKQALDDELPRLREAVDRKRAEEVALTHERHRH